MASRYLPTAVSVTKSSINPFTQPFVKNIRNVTFGFNATNLVNIEILSFEPGAIVDFSGAQISGGDQPLTSAPGPISLTTVTTTISDPGASATSLSSIPQYTLPDGSEGQIKYITTTTGNIEVTGTNFDLILTLEDPSASLIFTGGEWEFLTDNFLYPILLQEQLAVLGTTVSTSISADGNTLVVGFPLDTGANGRALTYTRNAGVWTAGVFLVGAGAVGLAQQGNSVAMSGDGNTLAIGGPGDNGGIGAVWVFTLSGAVWTQQGGKITPGGATGSSQFSGGSANAIALSYNGDTMAVGGFSDNGGDGGVWIFTRSAGVWSQEAGPLVGSGASGSAQQGFSVALDPGGDTLVEGGFADNSNLGAVWIFTRSAGVWTEFGSKLTPIGASGNSAFGSSVQINGGANLIIVGGPSDSAPSGAVWIFELINSVWELQIPKIVGAAGNSNGAGVGISANGRFIAFGGTVSSNTFLYEYFNGVWTFVRDLTAEGFGISFSTNGDTLALAGGILGGDVNVFSQVSD